MRIEEFKLGFQVKLRSLTKIEKTHQKPRQVTMLKRPSNGYSTSLINDNMTWWTFLWTHSPSMTKVDEGYAKTSHR